MTEFAPSFILEIKMKIVTEEFIELFADYPLYSQEHAEDLMKRVNLAFP